MANIFLAFSAGKTKDETHKMNIEMKNNKIAKEIDAGWCDFLYFQIYTKAFRNLRFFAAHLHSEKMDKNLLSVFLHVRSYMGGGVFILEFGV